MEIEDVVKKLVGDIKPIGDSWKDSETFENLKVMCDLVNHLTGQIESVYESNKGDNQASVLKSANYAGKFLYELKERI